MWSAECQVEGRTVRSRSNAIPAIPHSALRTPHCMSVCRIVTRAPNALDCPHKYGPRVPPADLRRPRGADRRADRPRRGGMGARGADGGAVGGCARRARGDGGVGAPDGGPHGHHAPRPARARRRAGAPGAVVRPDLEIGQRIFVVLVALTAVPTALAVVGWALAVRTVGPSAGARVALEEMAASARQMVDRMDTTHLAPRERAAVREHLERLSGTIT